MKNLLRLSLVVITLLVLSFAYADKASAQGCVVTGATLDGGQVVNCSGVDNNGITTTNQADEVTVEENANITRSDTNTIDTENGDDFVLIKGGSITQTGLDDAVRLGNMGNNEVMMLGGTLIAGCAGIETAGDAGLKFTMEDGYIEAGDEGLDLAEGPDELYIKGGTIIGGSAAIQTRGSDDQIIITGGLLKQIDAIDMDPTIALDSGNDLVSVSHATVDATMAILGAIQGRAGDDTVRLGTGAEIKGIMYGNSFNLNQGIVGEGFNTLVFEMGVRPEFIDSTCELILSKNPQNDSVRVNGLLYEWRDFDVILCELVPAQPKPIPTLSEWGLIAMTGLIGIAGVLFVVRRRATTYTG